MRAARECRGPSPPAASSRTPPHPQTQTKNAVPPPDISPSARMSTAAPPRHAAAPDRSPPEKHPAAVSAQSLAFRQVARTALLAHHPSKPAPIFQDENIPPSPDRNSAHGKQTAPAGSPHRP